MTDRRVPLSPSGPMRSIPARKKMVPAGFMAKRVERVPDWLDAPSVEDIYSVSSCISKDFADFINYWEHNGYWLFDSPDAIRRLAEENALPLEGAELFYYEVYENQFDEKAGRWEPFGPEPSFDLAVRTPSTARLEGYDVVSFFAGTSPECSPLSCNNLAGRIRTNRHCLLSTFELAKSIVDNGDVFSCEPGPYRIFAVHTVDWPARVV